MLHLALALVAPLAGGGEEARPNVLFLLADDQQAEAVSAYGHPDVRTPALDRLAEEGVSFRAAYHLGSPHGAVCMPSRAMLHTGRPWFELEIGSLAGRPLLGERLGEAGYETFGTGKWHNGRESFARSFQEGREVFFGGMCDHFAVPVVDLGPEGFTPERTGTKHSSELFADAAIEFLGREHERPFFCYVAFTAPHDPRDAPEEWMRPHQEDPPELPANRAGQHPFDNGFLTVRDEDLLPWPRRDEDLAQQLAEYLGLVEHMDAQIGRILAVLEERGLAENTIVVHAADHGLAMGQHGLLGKQSLYEHSFRLPLVLRGPGLPADHAVHSPVYLHDLLPTLLAAAGARPVEDTIGLDLAPLWRGEALHLHASVLGSMGTTQRALRRGPWKLIRYPAIDRTQLFHLERDPLEQHDLAGLPEHAARIEELRAELQAWQRRVGDDLPWTAAELRPAEVDLTGHPRRPDRWQPDWIREKYFED